MRIAQRRMQKRVNARTELYGLADGMQRRGTLTAEQALAMRAEASCQLVDELIVRAHATDAAAATAINGLLDELLGLGRITQRQAGDVRAALRPDAATPPTPASDPRQLELLAELRRTGALTEAEYQAEIERLQRGGQTSR